MEPTLQEKGTGLWGLELPGEGRVGSGPAAPAAAGDSRSSPAARHSDAAVAALHTASTAAHLAAHTARHRGSINLEQHPYCSLIQCANASEMAIDCYIAPTPLLCRMLRVKSPCQNLECYLRVGGCGDQTAGAVGCQVVPFTQHGHQWQSLGRMAVTPGKSASRFWSIDMQLLHDL